MDLDAFRKQQISQPHLLQCLNRLWLETICPPCRRPLMSVVDDLGINSKPNEVASSFHVSPKSVRIAGLSHTPALVLRARPPLPIHHCWSEEVVRAARIEAD